MNRLVSILLFLSCALAQAATFYASTNTSGGNGLSTNTPWPLLTALASTSAGDTILVMPGVYSNADWEPNHINQTIKSQVRWGAKLYNGNPFAGLAFARDGITLDGFEIAYASNNAVAIGTLTNITVRNCWIHNNGFVEKVAGNPSTYGNGVQSSTSYGILVENCLIEFNGSMTDSGGHGHGVYLSGTNCIVRNNVLRWNGGGGIQFDDSGTHGTTNLLIYNNLIYNNARYGIVLGSGNGTVDASVFGNTVLCTNICLQIGAAHSRATLRYTNNILYGGVTLLQTNTIPSVTADYNLMNKVDALPLGAHGILTNYAGFMNTNGGLYWLKSDSPARSKALPAIHGTNDFFGTSQSNVIDIGSFQYSDSYAADARTLDPSPSTGADYWKILSSVFPTAPQQFIISRKH